MLDTPVAYKTLMCLVCGWIYSEKDGEPDEGLAPGTRWDDIPDSWVCPECGVGKIDFTMVEI
ncbi:rubredoxin [Paraherbaspirillum soli]|uniref:Rubredoxin n=1 Tax=Paraherbaspirillum soli TaxID=631222 RepID=A0ABW0MGL5_9BURK